MNDHGRPAFQEPVNPEHPTTPDDVSIEPMDQALIDKMQQAFYDNNIPDTLENRRRFLESENIREALEARGVHPDRVAATADGKGHVRLDFDAIRTLLGKSDD